MLSTKAVEAAKPGPARREIPDAAVPGLRLVVHPTGSKAWVIRYRHDGGPRKLTLGPLAPSTPGFEPTPGLGKPLTLKGARIIAREQLLLVQAGRDVAEARQVEKRQRLDEPDRDLVSTIVDGFLARYLKARAKPGYYRSTQRIFDKDVLPKWGKRRIQEITRRDVRDLLDDVISRGAKTQANRVLAAIRKLFNWCLDRDVIATSPAAGVKAPNPENPRQRVLSDDELRLVWLAAGEMGYPWGHMVKVLILTGVRRDEAAGMRRSEIAPNGGVWTLPGERTKNSHPHTLPSAALASILADCPRIAVDKKDVDVPSYRGVRDYVFTLTGLHPVSGYHKAKARLDATMLKIAQREARARGDDAGEIEAIPHWTFHDLRRTFASGLARLRVPLPVVEKMLNHRSGSFGGIVSVYQLHSFEDEAREALKLWAAHVARCAARQLKRAA